MNPYTQRRQRPFAISFPRKFLRRWRNQRWLLMFISAFSSIMFAMIWNSIPVLYDDIWRFEEGLPQHRQNSSVVPQSYLWFEGMLTGHGLNNVLQEALLMSYVAYEARRSFVFQDYIWSTAPLSYVLYLEDFTLRPTRIPLNAFISGPTAGGPLPNDERSAVSLAYFQNVCPPHRQKRISSDDSPTDEDGYYVLEWWRRTLARHANEPCLVVTASSKKVFDWDLIGSKRALSLYSALIDSPILSSFRWSPVIRSGVRRNLPLIAGSTTRNFLNPEIPGLVAIHLRRGDYIRHCPRLARQRAEYVGVNNSPQLIDQFDLDGWVAEHEGIDPEPYYLEHCLPSIDQVLDRLKDVREDNPGLKNVFVLSNASRSWLHDLSKALKSNGWNDVKSTVDLRLDLEQSYVGMAVDMAIAETAEVFVGNGFSSLSANIVMLRMAKGLRASTNRLL